MTAKIDINIDLAPATRDILTALIALIGAGQAKVIDNPVSAPAPAAAPAPTPVTPVTPAPAPEPEPAPAAPKKANARPEVVEAIKAARAKWEDTPEHKDARRNNLNTAMRRVALQVSGGSTDKPGQLDAGQSKAFASALEQFTLVDIMGDQAYISFDC